MRVSKDHGLSSRSYLYNGIVVPDVWPPTTRPISLAPQPPGYISSPPDPIIIDSRRQLFVDDFLIESTSMTRTFYAGTQYGSNPVLTPSVTALSFPFSDGVWFDPSDNTYKADYFYDDQTTARAHSVDGKVWTKPNLGVYGSPTNATLQLPGTSGRDSSTTWLDLNDIPSRRWKLLQNQYTVAAIPRDNHLVLYYSSDGVHWGSPVATSGNLGALSDRNTFFYNPFLNKWVLSLRDIISGVGRARRYLEGDNLATMVNGLTNVQAQTFWTCADTLDPPMAGSDIANPALYTLDCVGYESVLLGLFTIIEAKSVIGNESNHVELGFSRDGFWWDRTSRVKVAPCVNTSAAFNNPAIWNAANVQSVGGCVMDVGTETWLYTSGRNNFADTMGLWIFRKNGFASMDAGSSEQTLTVRPSKFIDSTLAKLYVNVNAAGGGSLKAEIQDGFGRTISAFSKANCTGVTSDSTDVQMTWSGSPSLASLVGQRFRLVFYGTNSKLYAYRLGT